MALCLSLALILFTFVDLAPEVQPDFFFATDDPQFQTSLRIEEEFGDSQQVFITARAPQIASRPYLLRLRDLTEDFRSVRGVIDVRSLTHGPEKPDEIPERDPRDVFEDLAKSPFWTRLLLTTDRSATFVVLRLEGNNHRATIEAIDEIVARNTSPSFELNVSGVPYVAEHIRRRLTDDLRRFSIAAFVAFALLITLLFRSLAVLLGTMVAAFTACFATFLIRAAAGMETDILVPNLWTIAFVLTLSHVVYLTAEWRRSAREMGSERAVRAAIRLTGPAAAWSLAANLLGFASLIFVSAKPLRQFGISGVIASVLAMACAFGIFPLFLREARLDLKPASSTERRLDKFFASPHRIAAVAVFVCALALAPFAWRVNTDPSLPSYFAQGDPVRAGLVGIDRSAGSSPLDVVVRDASGGRFDNDDAFGRLVTLQTRLEQHPDVGSVLSVAALMAEVDRPWYSFLYSWETGLERAESPDHGSVGRTFVSEDRRRGRFILRMREGARSRPRETVVGEIRRIVADHGFEPVLIGGLYTLQGELSKLVDGSVLRGLAGLFGCFFVIVLIVTRSLRSALTMVSCLALPPFLLFGLVGLFRMPVDIISAPAANVALPLGIDEMIHLGYMIRRLRKRTANMWEAWKAALRQMWRPILASMLIVASGFALFLVSNFPPTRRLGLLVCVGAVITDLVVLVVLPGITHIARHARSSAHREA